MAKGRYFIIVVMYLMSLSVEGSKQNRTFNKNADGFKDMLRILRLKPNQVPPKQSLPDSIKTIKRTIPVIPRDTSGTYQNLKIAAFNVRVFGETKMKYPNVPEILVNIILRYDVILIMEIRDTKATAIYELLRKVNQASNGVYKMIISPRLGRTMSKEEYAFLYRTDALSVVRHYTYDDGDENLGQDTFEREPFIVQFQSKNAVIKDFVLVAIHTSPSSAPKEVDSLVDVYDDVIAKWSIDDVIILGDLNSACDYMSDLDWKTNRLYNDQRFTWLIHDCMDTTVGGSMCAYDRFVIAGSSMKNALVPGTADRFTFDKEYNLKKIMALLVSDHYPIELELYSKGLYKAMQSIQETAEYNFYSQTPLSLTSRDIYKIRYKSNPLLTQGFVEETLKSYSGAIAVITNKKKVTSTQDALQAFALIYSHWASLLTKDQVDLASHKIEVDYKKKSFQNAYVKLICRKIPSPVECWVALGM